MFDQVEDLLEAFFAAIVGIGYFVPLGSVATQEQIQLGGTAPGTQGLEVGQVDRSMARIRSWQEKSSMPTWRPRSADRS